MLAILSEKTRADLGWDVLLAHLAQRCHTDRGADLARKLLPIESLADVHAMQGEVAEARGLADSGDGISLGGVRDLRVALSRAEKGGLLLPDELCDVSRTLSAGARLRRHLAARAERAPRLLGRAALIAELPEVSGPIDDAFDESGQLRDNASPALRGLRRRAQDLHAELSQRADGILDQGHISPHLQDRFVTQREGRYVVPVRADARSKVRGIVHGQSSSGATVFVEPEEIIDLNNRLKLAQIEVADEERRILLDLSQRVQHAASRIGQNLDVLAVLDLIDGAARFSTDLRATPVPLHPPGEKGIDLRNARHPLLQLGGGQVVPNDVRVPAAGTLVVSGPNAGGKTVALKLAGLCALMARSGLHCPVQEGSSMPAFDEVLTDVGDDQSLERSLSSFSAHVLNLCAFLSRSSPGTLVLLDEITGGTDPEQGAALAQAVLEAMAESGATVIVTTHYDRLKALAPQDPRFVNASVGYDLEHLQPTYRLHLGVPGASGAVLVARRLGLPGRITERATALLGSDKTGVEELLRVLSRERESLLSLQREAAADRERARVQDEQAQSMREQARAELSKARRHAHDDAIAALRGARSELEDAKAQLKKSQQEAEGKASPEGLVQARQRIDRLAKDIAQAAPQPAGPAGRPARPEEIVIGARVLVPRLGGIGTVMSDRMRDKVVVQVGALKLNVEIAELRIPEGGMVRAAARQERAVAARGGRREELSSAMAPASSSAGEPAGRGPPRTAAGTLDLRGERVDVALSRSEKFMDDALRDGQPAIFILHGHGTGALRGAIRDHFRGYPGVSAMYPAASADGGDGVTVIELS